MARMKIVKYNYNENYTVLVNFNGILLPYKQYKTNGRNLLIGQNSLTKENVDIYDLDEKVDLPDGWMEIEKATIYKNKGNYIYLNGKDDNGNLVPLTVHYLVEYTWLNSTKPADRYVLDPDGEPKYNIAHKNGNKEDCSLPNIGLQFREENILDAYLQGYANGHKYLSDFLLKIRNWPVDRKKEIYAHLGELFLEWSKK